jgi:ElaB/YqjD/DUF883 family membrane-anchored ribosome-binding protein
VAHRASDGAHYVREKASDSASYISHKAQDGYHYASDKAGEVRDTSTRYYQDNPLAVGAILLGAGALIGMLTPLSRPEREGLRGVADKVGRTGAELAERGVRMVEERVDGAGNGQAMH